MNNKRPIIIIIQFIVASIVIACAVKEIAPPITKTEKTEEVKDVEVRENWHDEWERVKKEAKMEGKVVVYTGVGPEMRAIFAEEIFKEYGIKVESLSGRGGEIVEKIKRERRAGIYAVDLYISGPTTIVTQIKPENIMAPLEPLLILPEVKEPSMWYKGKLDFLDKEKKLLRFSTQVRGGIHINSNSVKPGEINSLRDLLSPKWEGKIIIDDPVVAGRGEQLLTLAIINLGEDYVRQLAKQKLVITRNRRQLTDWIVKGSTPIGIGVYDDQYREYREAGAPIREVALQEVMYMSGGFGHVIYLDKAPNPNASKVFLNWLLSKKGQILWQKNMESQSARVDVPVDDLTKAEVTVRQPGVDYFDVDREEYLLKVKSEVSKIIKEVFVYDVR